MTTPRVSVTALPDDSALRQRAGTSDFLDCFAVRADAPPREAAEIIAAFPGWARFLLTIRRIVTAPFGLSNDGPDATDKIGPFPVELDTPTELVAGFDDRHQDFRISVISRESTVSLATWVRPHNIGGRLYLALIMPFHIMIARNALSRVAAARPVAE